MDCHDATFRTFSPSASSEVTHTTSARAVVPATNITHNWGSRFYNEVCHRAVELSAHMKRLPGYSCAVAVRDNKSGVKIYSLTGGHDGMNRSVTPQTVFRACSISKVAVSALALRMHQLGQLPLDLPIAGYFDLKLLPEKLSSDPRMVAVTPRMLLSHTSGLGVTSFDVCNRGERRRTPLMLLHLRSTCGDVEFHFTPGQQWRYSGAGYTLLAAVIEAITGQPIARVLQEDVFTPLEMEESSYSETFMQGMAAGMEPDGSIVSVSPARCVASAGLFASASDLAKLALAVSPGSSFLTHPLTHEFACDQRSDDSQGRAWSVGWQLDKHETASGKHVDIMRHAGCRPGWWGHVEVYPALETAFVSLTNRTNGNQFVEPLISTMRNAAFNAIYMSTRFENRQRS